MEIINGQLLNDDSDYQFNLKTAKQNIKNWKRWYFRKNSKHAAKIQLRCSSAAPDPAYWKYFIELWINDKLMQQDRIMREAYDTFDYDKSLKKTEYPGIEIITLLEYDPK